MTLVQLNFFEKSMSQRNPLIDIARGLGIILVVFGHNWIIAHEHGVLFRLVFSFHMPLFFFLSGLFLNETESVGRFIKLRADTLLKPFFVVLMVWGLARLVIAKIAVLPYFFGVLYATGHTIEWVPLWFLPHLFLSLLMVLFILKLSSTSLYMRPVRLFLCLTSLLLGWWCMTRLAGLDWQNISYLYPLVNDYSESFPGLPWSIDVIGISSAYILAGFLAKEAVAAFRLRWMFLFATFVIFALFQWQFQQAMDLHMRYYGNPAISSIEAGLGIYLSLGLAAFLQRFVSIAKVLALLGKSSLFILLFHSWIEWKVYGILQIRLHQNYAAALFALFAGIFLPVGILWIVQRSPWLSVCLLSTGSRK